MPTTEPGKVLCLSFTLPIVMQCKAQTAVKIRDRPRGTDLYECWCHEKPSRA